ncbi:hypothetical protein [Streptomyces sp. KR55]
MRQLNQKNSPTLHKVPDPLSRQLLPGGRPELSADWQTIEWRH